MHTKFRIALGPEDVGEREVEESVDDSGFNLTINADGGDNTYPALILNVQINEQGKRECTLFTIPDEGDPVGLFEGEW